MTSFTYGDVVPSFYMCNILFRTNFLDQYLNVCLSITYPNDSKFEKQDCTIIDEPQIKIKFSSSTGGMNFLSISALTYP